MTTELKVGDRVRHRQWTVPAVGKQEPIVWKRIMRITEKFVDQFGTERIYCGHHEFRAFELIQV